MAAKVFKTIDEQLDILKSKGLTIEDYEISFDKHLLAFCDYALPRE